MNWQPAGIEPRREPSGHSLMSKPDRSTAWTDAAVTAEVEAFAPERVQAKTVAFLCLNATGVGSSDRPVSFGAVKLSLTPPGEIAFLHLVFDPECDCAPDAARRHGYSERELRHQDCFEGYAKPQAQWLGEAELRVADTAVEFRILRDALAASGVSIPAPERTLRSFRFFGETPPSLDAMASRLNFVRPSRHGALRDAWLCMQTYLWIHGLPWRLDYALAGDPTPSNYRAPPRSAFESLFRRRA